MTIVVTSGLLQPPGSRQPDADEHRVSSILHARGSAAAGSWLSALLARTRPFDPRPASPGEIALVRRPGSVRGTGRLSYPCSTCPPGVSIDPYLSTLR